MNTRFIIGIAVAFILVACGESVTEKVVDNQISVVKEVADLPHCEKSNKGEQVFVEADSAIRVCDGKNWLLSVDDTVYVQDNIACYSEKLSDNSGVKILCNGDSIGVVYNGEKGSQGKKGNDGLDGEQGNSGLSGDTGDNGIGCFIRKVDETSVRVVCAKDSTTLYIGETYDDEKIAVSMDEVSGASQKGPFLSGSTVKVSELMDGRTLKEAGGGFSGKIMNDKGEFKINGRTLMSQYVKLEARGYYRNEVTGGKSESELTLFAISDVSTRNVVNVNLLTHLELERVSYLVTHDKMKFKAAKKQAQKEVLALFDIDAENFSNSEDLNIAGGSDEDGALLAFSILLQGGRSVAELSELLTKIAKDMETDGTWDDYSTKSSIVEWAVEADRSGKLDSIRNNVKNWKLSSVVPNFEQHVKHFWVKELGLEDCNEKNLGEVKDNGSKGIYAGYETRFICREVDGEYRWDFATDFEKDTYLWTAGDDGEIKYGSVTGKKYLYDAEKKEWRLANPVEEVLGGCTESIAKDISKNTGHARYAVDGVWGEWLWYKCEGRSWVETTELFVNTQGWQPGKDGELARGDSIMKYYVYDEAEGLWREAGDNDFQLGLNGCTTNRTGETLLSKTDNQYYGCSSNHQWTPVDNKVFENTEGHDCDEEGKIILGKLDVATHFVCDAGVWREAREDEERAGESCTLAKVGSFSKDSTWICIKETWEGHDDYVSVYFRHTEVFDYPIGTDWTNPNLTYGTLLDKRDGHTYKTIEINGFTVMAENLIYNDVLKNPYLQGNTKCVNDDSTYCPKGGRLYTWAAAMDLDPKWNKVVATEKMVKYPHRGICPAGWHIPTIDEWKSLVNGIKVTDLLAKVPHIWDESSNGSGFSAIPTSTFQSGRATYLSASEDDGCGANDYVCAYVLELWPSDYEYSYDMWPSNGKGWSDFSVRCIEDYE